MTNTPLLEIKNRLQFFNTPSFVFNEDLHLYTFDDTPLISVTTFISKYFKPKFDSDYWSKKKAEERGITQAEILKEWDDKRIISSELGTACHLFAENYANGLEQYTRTDNEYLKRTVEFKRFYNDYLKQGNIIQTELKMFCLKYKIAGTTDLLFLSENGNLIIIDYKFSKEIKTKCYKNNMIMKPFDFLYNNDLSIYSIQLSIYKLMMEEADDYFKTAIRNMLIVSFPENDSVKIFPAIDYSKTIRDYFDYLI